MTGKASKAAIEAEVAEYHGNVNNYGHPACGTFTKRCDDRQARSDAIRAYFDHHGPVPESLAPWVLPVEVDPVLELAREIVAFPYGAGIAQCIKAGAAAQLEVERVHTRLTAFLAERVRSGEIQ